MINQRKTEMKWSDNGKEDCVVEDASMLLDPQKKQTPRLMDNSRIRQLADWSTSG